MIRYLSIVGFGIALVACDSEVTHTTSHRSPDGKRHITVAQELQGTNDPSPWWTHVSLTTTGDDFTPHKFHSYSIQTIYQNPLTQMESNWKYLREIVPQLRERYLADRNARIVEMLVDPEKNGTERYRNTSP